MNKDDLLVEMDKLIKKYNDLYQEFAAVAAELNEKTAQIGELQSENDRLNAELKELKAGFEDIRSMSLPEISPEDEDAGADASSEVKPLLPELHFGAVSETVEAASECIGEVVLKCADLCSNFAASEDPNAKDLINLALGRTEVFKSEVLEIVSQSTADTESLKTLIWGKASEVFEYFDILQKQL